MEMRKRINVGGKEYFAEQKDLEAPATSRELMSS